MVQDPVCGMKINEAEAAGTAEYNGAKYYFCSPSCQATFEKEPDKYAGTPGGHHH